MQHLSLIIVTILLRSPRSICLMAIRLGFCRYASDRWECPDNRPLIAAILKPIGDRSILSKAEQVTVRSPLLD
ncbi:MAG: hypothetical protein WBA57_22660 [Elainellaceae cyanobacterium]